MEFEARQEMGDGTQSFASLKEASVIKHDLFGTIRDATSTEYNRAIQDSESVVALKQKNLILGMVRKGLTKNQIIREMQMIYGNDVLIYPEKVDDTRSFAQVYSWKAFKAAAIGIPVLYMYVRFGMKGVRRR
mmetsp:Transcript_25622/g.39425  ORF Transcript_25622/g.39425 Transcript_25622/m.39425 type:complete len:132 (-) Transcript_25622:16-411(-)